jgi:hypothetical protein
VDDARGTLGGVDEWSVCLPGAIVSIGGYGTSSPTPDLGCIREESETPQPGSEETSDALPLHLPPHLCPAMASVCGSDEALFSVATAKRRVAAPAIGYVPYAGLRCLAPAPLDFPYAASQTQWLATSKGPTAGDVSGTFVVEALSTSTLPSPRDDDLHWTRVPCGSAEVPPSVDVTSADSTHPLSCHVPEHYVTWAFDPFSIEVATIGPTFLRLLWECRAVAVYDPRCWGESLVADEDVSDAVVAPATDHVPLLLHLPTVLALVEAVRRRYRDNAFHSFHHGLHVCQATALLLRDTLLEPVMSPLDKMAVIFAALSHDVDHPAVNNDLMGRLSTPLSLRYNDQSVLENHHSATTFALLTRPSTAAWASLSERQARRARRVMITSILATDMAKHFSLIETIKTMQPVSSTLDDKQSLILCEVVVHAADVSGQTQPWRLASQWSDLIAEEFSAQVQRELREGLAPTAFMSNLHTLMARAELQRNFCSYVLLPMWRPLVDVFPTVSECAARIEANQARYADILQREKDLADAAE